MTHAHRRLWLGTLAVAALIWVLHDPIPPARAAEPARCQLVDSGKGRWEAAGADVALQTAALLDSAGDRRIVVVPFGRTLTGTGGDYSIVCTY